MRSWWCSAPADALSHENITRFWLVARAPARESSSCCWLRIPRDGCRQDVRRHQAVANSFKATCSFCTQLETKGNKNTIKIEWTQYGIWPPDCNYGVNILLFFWKICLRGCNKTESNRLFFINWFICLEVCMLFAKGYDLVSKIHCKVYGSGATRDSSLLIIGPAPDKYYRAVSWNHEAQILAGSARASRCSHFLFLWYMSRHCFLSV